MDTLMGFDQVLIGILRYMILKKIFVTLFLCASLSIAFTQNTYVYQDVNRPFKEGVRLFSEGVYELADAKFSEAITGAEPI